MNVAGIDVAHKTLALAIRVGEKTGKVQELANTASGHLTAIKAARVERVCLAATGTYHLDLALALEAAGLAPMGGRSEGRQALCRGPADPHQDRCGRCRGALRIRPTHAV